MRRKGLGVGVYELDNPDDRLRLALDQPTPHHRASVLRKVSDKYGRAESLRILKAVKERMGELEAQATVEALYTMQALEAKRKGAA